jgi:ribonuclease Z
MVQVTFMGTGAAFSTNRRTNVALLVREGGTSFLVECGPTILFQLDRAGSAADRVTHLFVSHRHGDHILGLPMFLLTRCMNGTSAPLTILGSTDVIQAGKALTQTVFPGFERRLGPVTWVEMPVDQATGMEVGPALHLSTLPVPHSANAPALALRLDFIESGRALVYTGDTSYTEEMGRFATACDLLVHEANFSEVLQPSINAGDYVGHSTARQAGQTAARADCCILALVHLSPAYAGQEDQVRAEAAQAFDGPIVIPSDGATLYL